MNWPDRLRRIGIPAIVFAGVWAFHYLWHGVFPEQDQTQSQWVEISAADVQWWDRYIATQSYWLGFSYALPMAFTAYAFQRYRRDCYCAGRKLALGGITLTGFLAIAGCFLIGCCGSPMLAMYLSIFGAGFIPLAKPIVALGAASAVTAAWLYLRFRRPTGIQGSNAVKTC